MVEVERAAQVASTTPEKLLEASYRLHTIAVTDLAVLDLTTLEAREAVGLEMPAQAVGGTGSLLRKLAESRSTTERVGYAVFSRVVDADYDKERPSSRASCRRHLGH